MDISKCETCTEDCPQKKGRHEAAVGRMYAMRELAKCAPYWDALFDEKEKPKITPDRLRELVAADRDGRCVVLAGKSKKNETIRDLVKIIEWISDSVKKHDFSPFRIVVGAPENTFPVVREYQRVTEKHEEEIYLAFKDKEVGNYMKGEQDG